MTRKYRPFRGGGGKSSKPNPRDRFSNKARNQQVARAKAEEERFKQLLAQIARREAEEKAAEEKVFGDRELDDLSHRGKQSSKDTKSNVRKKKTRSKNKGGKRKRRTKHKRQYGGYQEVKLYKKGFTNLNNALGPDDTLKACKEIQGSLKHKITTFGCQWQKNQDAITDCRKGKKEALEKIQQKLIEKKDNYKVNYDDDRVAQTNKEIEETLTDVNEKLKDLNKKLLKHENREEHQYDNDNERMTELF